MSDPREYRMLSDWYEDLAAVWLSFIPVCRDKMQAALHWEKTQAAGIYMELAHQCALRAGRYARLAEEAKEKHIVDQTNVTPMKAKP